MTLDQIWIVVPAFNEEENAPLFYERAMRVFDTMDDCEGHILFVDDRSTDSTPEKIEELSRKDPRVHGIRLAKNSGSHAACTAGLANVEGDCGIIMACDLQDPPEIIPDLVKKWREGNDVVWAVRRNREGHKGLNALMSSAYWWMMRKFALPQTHGKGADFFLCSKKVIGVYKLLPEKNRSIMALVSWLGFQQDYIEYDKKAREHGETKWNLAKKINFTIDSFVGFSFLPLRIMSLLGLLVVCASLVYACVIIVNYIATGSILGWSSNMLLLIGFSGVQMIMLGVIGEYLWRVLDEVRQRPYYILDKQINIGEKTAAKPKPKAADKK